MKSSRPACLVLALFLVASGFCSLSAGAQEVFQPESSVMPEVKKFEDDRRLGVRPAARNNHLPRARWEYRRNGELWTRIALAAINSHGQPLLATVPRDIADWCPAYPRNGNADRAAFWAGLLSALSRYESTWNPQAVGGGGRWFGLLQIYPKTAAFRECRAQTGEGLKRAAANLNCAVRIMAVIVPRDGAVALKESRWKGVAADWGPIRDHLKRGDMQRYLRQQTYCRELSKIRPRARP